MGFGYVSLKSKSRQLSTVCVIGMGLIHIPDFFECECITQLNIYIVCIKKDSRQNRHR